MKISVALSYNIFAPLTYQIRDSEFALKIGMRVLVPLGNKTVSGWVINLDSPYKGRLKNIIGIIDDPFCPDQAFLEFARQSATAYFTSLGSILDHALPANKKNLKSLYVEQDGHSVKLTNYNHGQLEKMASAKALRFFFRERTLEQPYDTPPPIPDTIMQNRLLLDSGREHDCLEISRAILGSGRSVLLLVPDNISARYWQKHYAGLDIYNSETRPAVKNKIWLQYQQGKTGIVCGGLSAVFLPLPNLGLLIIDRANSALYQRTFRSPFKTDHLARIRAQAGKTPLFQGSAAHSCASYWQREKITAIDRRHDRGILLKVHMLKGKERGIPEDLVQLLNQNFLQKKKTLVLLNKIQPALNLFCAKCGKIITCPGCGGILQVNEPQDAACRRCSFHQEQLTTCPRCQNSLTLLHDISLDSLARTIERNVNEKSVLTLSAADLKDMELIIPAVQASSIIIATTAAINPFFKEMFAAVIYFKPESFFSMDEFNSAEMIYATAAEILETLICGGDLHVFSVFHFHYALQFLLDEDKFFERELKYRQWFMLPPFTDVYQLEIRSTTLRLLAGTMRELYNKNKIELQIKKIYLASRQPLRGSFRGILELHAPAEKIIAAGLPQINKSSLTLLAG